MHWHPLFTRGLQPLRGAPVCVPKCLAFNPLPRLLPRLLILLTLLAAPGPAAAAQPAHPKPQPAALVGVVHRVVDGDSLWFTPTGQAPREVRLADMDAPELCQAYGPQAQAALGRLVLKQPARLKPVARDSYGRLVARLEVGGVDVSTRMVEEGHAHSARQRNNRGPLMKQERMARALARGLHATPGAVLPREFRRSHGPCRPTP